MENNQTIDIHPITRGKRMLVFLGDFFICLILNFVLMTIVQPLMSLATNLNGREEAAIQAEHKRDDILYSNNLLYFENETTKYDYNKNLDYTYQRFLSYYVFVEENPSDVKSSNFGHQQDNEIFAQYYVNIRSDSATYNNVLSSSKYFDISEGTKSLKNEYKDQLTHFFIKGDELSESGQEYYDDLIQDFLGEYALLIKDIYKNDLSDGVNSFNACQKEIDAYTSYSDWIYIISDLISFIFAWAITFILFPLIFENGKTLTMRIMHIERVGFNNLYVLRKGETVMMAFYQLPLSLIGMIVPPLAFIPFYYIFNLPLLIPLSLVSILFIITTFIALLVDKFRRSGSDLLSRSVLISEDDFNAIVQAKGYTV